MSMRILLLLFTIWFSTTALCAQQVHLVFHDAPLSYALGQIDEAYPDVHIHFVIDQVEGLTISAVIDHTEVLDALHAALDSLPFSVRQEGSNLFISRSEDLLDADEVHRRDAICSYRLDEVLVLERLPQLPAQDDAALVLHVQGSELAHRGTAADLLAYLPGLRVGQQQITLLDNRTPLIYIDGVLVSSLTELHSLRSEEISRISLLETADATYSSPASIVIRIFTSAPPRGFDALAQVDATQGHGRVHQEHVKLRWHGERLQLSGGLLLRDADEYLDNKIQSSRYEMRPEVTSIHPYLQSAFHWDDHHTLGVKYELMDIVRPVAYWSRLLGIGNGYFNSIDISELNLTATSQWQLDYSPRHNAKLYYTGDWDRVRVNADMEYYSDNLNIVQHESSSNLMIDSLLSTRINGIGNELWSGRVEVRLPMGSGRLTVGNEVSSTRRLDDIHFLGSHRNRTMRRETQTALYAMGEWSWAETTVLVGLRDELLHAIIARAGQRSTYDKNYLLPYVGIILPSGLSLAYSVRTQRPNYNQLNGYTRFNQFMMAVSGNPDLTPAMRHIFQLQYRYGALHANLRYQHVSDYIASMVRQGIDANILDYLNLPQAEEFDATLTLSPRFGRFEPVASVVLHLQDLSMQMGGEYRQSFRHPMLFLDLHSPYALRQNLQLWADLHLQTTGHLGNILQHQSAVFNLGASVQFGHFDLSLRAEDIFRTGTQRREYFGPDTHFTLWSYSDTQRVGMTVAYFFNH